MSKSRSEVETFCRTTQLRGELLEKRIEVVMRDLAAEAKKDRRQYVYNASEVARIVPTTRRTLAKHGNLVVKVLQDLKSDRRKVSGEATVGRLLDQVTYLKAQLEIRERIIDGLRSHHIEIYKRFHEHSLDAELLVRPILEKECIEAGECMFCGTKVDSAAALERLGNVIAMRRR
jgi:hypothetical protein